MAGFADNEMVKERYIQEVSGFTGELGNSQIIDAGTLIVAGVVMRENHAGGVEAQGVFEQLANSDHSGIEIALVDQNMMRDILFGIQKQRPQLFVIEGVKVLINRLTQMRDHVGRCAHVYRASRHFKHPDGAPAAPFHWLEFIGYRWRGPQVKGKLVPVVLGAGHTFIVHGGFPLWWAEERLRVFLRCRWLVFLWAASVV